MFELGKYDPENRKRTIFARVHKGTQEIGGTCIEISTGKTSILLDTGSPLKKDSLPVDFSGLNPDAIFISHPHQDHYGLLGSINPEIPVYMGEVGKRLIEATHIFLDKPLLDNNFKGLKSNKSVKIYDQEGVLDMEITPFLVDHSAVDAFAFLIDIHGYRIFYSGDFRNHGRKSVLFDRMISNPPEDIDVLFLEGTMIARSNSDFPDEGRVEDKIYETLSKQKNISFLISSSQNIDRIVSAYRACKKANKILVVDFYTAWVLEQIKLISSSVPCIGWERIKVYADCRKYNKLKEHPEYFGDFMGRAFKCRVLKKELELNPSKYLYLGKMSQFKIVNLYKHAENPVNVIYSQWLGYLKNSNKEYYGAESFAAYQKDSQVSFTYAHTSGHATIETLQKFTKALNAKKVIPVHTEFPEKFSDYMDNVVLYEDGEKIVINDQAGE
ncbi:MBL fold metallo-hydrolase [bacterium]|nr:MBL fold metallo-hydrolase [bacterium]